MARTPAQPPVLPGYRPIQLLGSGGFADVFLYEQDLPRRKVAVKVLLDTAVDEGARARFVAEANAMAQLSTHPSIVTIHFAGVAPDGRPCLVMEYCPRPTLSVRLRRERIAVDEALRIGVRLASAVQTAHGAGILHRDIKPANVLVTEFGWPALADFGISAQIDVETDEHVALSVPWSAPELFQPDPRAGVSTDVYALGATVYALLAGRSPFEIPGGNNASAAMIARIEREPVPLTGRSDVPPMLERVLARAMHKRPEARYRSALEFARALQGIESDLGLPSTTIDVLDTDALVAGAGDSDDATRMRGVVTIDDQDFAPFDSGSDGHRIGLPAPEAAASGGSRTGLVLGLALLVLVVGVVAGVLLFGRDPGGGTPIAQPSDQPTLVTRQAPPAPENLQCTRAGSTLSCTWNAVDVEGVSGYRWALQERQADATQVTQPRLMVDLPPGLTPCVQVQTLTDDGQISAPASRCAG